jgi:hypothetical protein
LDVCFGQWDLGWATVNDHANTATMRFSPGGNAKDFTKRVPHGQRLRENLDDVKRMSNFRTNRLAFGDFY